MISIIICSRSSDIPSSFRKNIESTVGVDHEIIVIDNSENKYSIFAAYNRGISLSQYPYLCFVHDDVLFKTDSWGKKMIEHLNDPKTGIIGIAGGKIMAKTPAQWSNDSVCINIVQYKKDKIYTDKKPVDFSGNRQQAILLDGVFLCMRRNLSEKIHFDETFEGFHGYDYDICVQSATSGFNNYVVYDILLEHLSSGNGNTPFYINLISVHKKWEPKLPLFSDDIPKETRAKINEIETRRIKTIIRRMTTRNFSRKNIIENTKFFIEKAGIKDADKQFRHLGLNIFLIRVVRNPGYFFNNRPGRIRKI